MTAGEFGWGGCLFEPTLLRSVNVNVVMQVNQECSSRKKDIVLQNHTIFRDYLHSS